MGGLGVFGLAEVCHVGGPSHILEPVSNQSTIGRISQGVAVGPSRPRAIFWNRRRKSQAVCPKGALRNEVRFRN